MDLCLINITDGNLLRLKEQIDKIVSSLPFFVLIVDFTLSV